MTTLVDRSGVQSAAGTPPAGVPTHCPYCALQCGMEIAAHDTGHDVRGTEFPVNAYTTGSQDDPSVSSVAGGGFVVAWESYVQDGEDDGIFAQLYDSAGRIKTMATVHELLYQAGSFSRLDFSSKVQI